MTVARLALPICALAIALLAAAVGSSFMSFDRVVAALIGTGSRADGIILWNIRLPRVCLAALSGAALALAGVLLQRVTRNPLAAPSVLGVVDGAAVGVLVFLWVFSNESNALTVSIHWQPVAAAFGAFSFATCVAFLAKRDISSPMRLILYGVACAALANAIVVLLIIAGPVYRASAALIWLAGSVHTADWREVTVLAIALAISLPFIGALLKPLDQLRLDDASAQATGLSVLHTRVGALVLSVSLTVAAVSVVGGIGFVGLIAPHAARLLFGTRALAQFVGAALIGMVMVMAADIIVRLAFQPLEVPAGAITALVGAPYFLFLLIRRGRSYA